MTTQNTSHTEAAPEKTIAGKWIHVLKTGTHIASDGREVTFTAADLDQMIANHALGAAPAVIGHPKQNAPAYGWTDDVKREGGNLYVKFAKVNPAFDVGVQSGAYYNRSLSVIKDGANGYRIRHVGWLGAQPPAIDGLEPVNFSGSDPEDVMEFASPMTLTAWTLQTVAGMFRRVREYLIAEKGIEEADRILPNYELDSLASDADSLGKAAAENDNSTTGDPMSSPVSFSQADIDAAVLKAKEEAKAEAKKEAELEFSAQVNEANQKAATIEGERRAERISAQIESWKKEGKVLPAETSGMAEFMASLDGGSAFEFSASDGEKKSKSASEWFAEFMAKQPKRIDLNRQSATEDGDPQPKTAEELAAKALEFQKEKADKGIVISISEAMSAVTGE